MRVTLASLLTVLLSAAALFGFAAAHQDFGELKARHVPNSYLGSRDLSFSHEEFDARDGFNPEYEGVQARGEALDVPFQLSLRDFLEEAVVVYRREEEKPFTLTIVVEPKGKKPIEVKVPNVGAATILRTLLPHVAPALGLSPNAEDLDRRIVLVQDVGYTYTNPPLGRSLGECRISARTNRIYAKLAETYSRESSPSGSKAPGNRK
ncbi:hypothetical protein DFP72DRAFT_1052464 [Ephemerocybe angulata]|uniref:Uncharacterized protein n=1 Tax=Ephemerocybe angulata TaxID=980116 RepID=A0A8H6LU41_9AGAR|nr:hypothetical protein DFP72DRAFT_1052464 [Tulosesus angulatus]